MLNVLKPSEEILRGLQDACSSGEYSRISRFMDERVRYFVPGYSSFAGTYHGINEVVDFLKRVAAHHNQHPLIVRQLEVSSSDRHMAERSVTQALIDGHSVEWTQTTLYFFDRGRIYECRMVVSNAEAYDEYWSLSEEQIADDGDTRLDLAKWAGRVP